MEVAIFLVAAAIVLGGAVGVILSRNPVHAALSLVASFFGIAVLFVAQGAHFLAFVQVVVYSGAVMVLLLFVIMLLGVDESEDLSVEPLAAQRPVAIAVGVLFFGMLMAALFVSGPSDGPGKTAMTGQMGANAAVPIDPEESNLVQLATDLFTRNLLAFEATALLLTVATVGAVVLVKNSGAEDLVVDEPGTASR